MVVVRCLICQDGFSKSDALKRHFVDAHSIPENDDVLNRYVHLRFSLSSGDVVRKQKMLVRLLKLLKSEVIVTTNE